MHASNSYPFQHLQDALNGQDCLIASSVFDAMSARIAQSIGSHIGIMGGSVASQAILGAPDLVLMTASELVEQSRRICRTNCVDLIVDADHGYGNALNVMRTVEDLQAAGVAGVCLEDTALPQAYSQTQPQVLLSLDEGRQKISAALQARGRGPMMIFGRTNAVSSHGIEEALKRLLAYEDLNVDALFVPYLTQRSDLEYIARRVHLPIITAGCHADLYEPKFLKDCGVKIWMWGHQPLLAAYSTLRHAMQAAHEGTPPSKILLDVEKDLFTLLTDADTYGNLADRFLKPNQQ